MRPRSSLLRKRRATLGPKKRPIERTSLGRVPSSSMGSFHSTCGEGGGGGTHEGGWVGGREEGGGHLGTHRGDRPDPVLSLGLSRMLRNHRRVHQPAPRKANARGEAEVGAVPCPAITSHQHALTNHHPAATCCTYAMWHLRHVSLARSPLPFHPASHGIRASLARAYRL
jgi:hypothetical protein